MEYFGPFTLHESVFFIPSTIGQHYTKNNRYLLFLLHDFITASTKYTKTSLRTSMDKPKRCHWHTSVKTYLLFCKLQVLTRDQGLLEVLSAMCPMLSRTPIVARRHWIGVKRLLRSLKVS